MIIRIALLLGIYILNVSSGTLSFHHYYHLRKYIGKLIHAASFTWYKLYMNNGQLKRIPWPTRSQMTPPYFSFMNSSCGFSYLPDIRVYVTDNRFRMIWHMHQRFSATMKHDRMRRWRWRCNITELPYAIDFTGYGSHIGYWNLSTYFPLSLCCIRCM